MPLDPKKTLKKIRINEPLDERTAALKEFDAAILKLAEDITQDSINAVAKAEQKLKEVDNAYREGVRLLLVKESMDKLALLEKLEKLQRPS